MEEYSIPFWRPHGAAYLDKCVGRRQHHWCVAPSGAVERRITIIIINHSLEVLRIQAKWGKKKPTCPYTPFFKPSTFVWENQKRFFLQLFHIKIDSQCIRFKLDEKSSGFCFKICTGSDQLGIIAHMLSGESTIIRNQRGHNREDKKRDGGYLLNRHSYVSVQASKPHGTLLLGTKPK